MRIAVIILLLGLLACAAAANTVVFNYAGDFRVAGTDSR